MPAIITVVGATGGQGGSVARALLADKSGAYKVRATTRNVESDLAQRLAAAGVEVVKADGLIKQEMLEAFRGSWGVFLNINSDDPSINTPNGPRETDLGKLMLDAAFEAGVKHVVFSSLASATEISGGKVPNDAFDEKHAIEEYGRSRGFATFTAVSPGEYMENFLVEAIAPVFGGFPYIPNEEGVLTFRLPAWGGNEEVPYLCLNTDFGDIVHAVFLNPTKYNKAFIQAFSDSRTHDDVTRVFEEVTGKKCRHEILEKWQDLPTLGLTVLETVQRMHGFCQESNGWYYGSPNDKSLAAELKRIAAEAQGKTGDGAELMTLQRFFATRTNF